MEKNTSAFVAKVLRQSGISVKTGIGGYGVVGLLKGKNKRPGDSALRADMDALPVQRKIRFLIVLQFGRDARLRP